MRILRYISVFFGTLLISALSYAQSESSVFSAQYSYGDGAEAFILKQSLIDNLDYDATLQMHASNEVWVLNKAQGARGTVLYRNDTGRVFLRVNPIGGATLYPTPDSIGIPV